MSDDAIERGVELLSKFEEGDIDLATALDRLETVTTDPHRTRSILDAAEKRGIIEREDARLRIRSGAYVSYERDVITKEGEFTCRRCGASLTTGHFIKLDAGEHGPFGSSCIKKVTGRR